MRILNFSTHHEACGIGKYQESFIEALGARPGVESRFFDMSPNRVRPMPQAEYEATMSRLVAEAADYDLVHVQHEWGFFSRDELQRVVDGVHAIGKKVAVTVHTSPAVLPIDRPARRGIGPRAVLTWLRELRRWRALQNRMIAPLRQMDLVIVHNEATRQSLIGLGVPGDRIVKIVLPVRASSPLSPSRRIREELDAREGDVVLCTVGFLHRFKGVDAAVKALMLLPPNFKLAIIGGVHPETDNPGIYDDLVDLVRELGLLDRVYITGYVENDDELDALIRGCDVAVYPYDRIYYANVSSAALTNALANGMPTVAYPTSTFRELNEGVDAIRLTSAFSYYELARTVRSISPAWPNASAAAYAELHSFDRAAEELVGIYGNVLGRSG